MSYCLLLYENQGADTRIYLKKDVKWNDGKPFSSKDVICTYYLGYAAGSPMWNYGKSIETPDDYTVIIHWMKEEGFPLRKLTSIHEYLELVQ